MNVLPVIFHDIYHTEPGHPDTQSENQLATDKNTDDGCTPIAKWFTVLSATWILLPHTRTLTFTHRPTSTTRIRGILLVTCFAACIHIVGGAVIDSTSQTILQNAAQIKILDCFTAYQQRQHLGGYDSEESDDNAQLTDG
jgi:hypothetical protein